MTYKIARITTDVFDGSMEYEIYGRELTDSDAVEDDFKNYLEQEVGCEGDGIICFSTITRGSSIMEYVAWLEYDTHAVLATFDARFAIKTMMSFMTWFWRGQYKKATAPQPKSNDTDSVLLSFREITDIAHDHAKRTTATTTAYEKPFYIDDEKSVQVVWKFLLEGVVFKTDFEGERFTLGHYGDYEEDTISVVFTTVRKQYFVKNWKELYTLFRKLEILNVAWGFNK